LKQYCGVMSLLTSCPSACVYAIMPSNTLLMACNPFGTSFTARYKYTLSNSTVWPNPQKIEFTEVLQRFCLNNWLPHKILSKSYKLIWIFPQLCINRLLCKLAMMKRQCKWLSNYWLLES
jgi:hypothetical protein